MGTKDFSVKNCDDTDLDFIDQLLLATSVKGKFYTNPIAEIREVENNMMKLPTWASALEACP